MDNKLFFSDLTLEKINKFKQNYKKVYFNSESSLVNAYIWCHYYNSKICINNDTLYTIFNTKSGDTESFMPYGKETFSTSSVDKLIQYFKDNYDKNLVINLASEEFLHFLKASTKYKFSYKEVENSFDYLYYTKDLINLSGRKYHPKRNKISKFTQKHQFETRVYTDEFKDECIMFCDKVIKSKYNDINNVFYKNEMESVIKIFNTIDLFDLDCLMIYVNEKLIALSVGEKINDNCALIHVEKADYEYRDAYALINNLMLKEFYADLEFVNREEDMGIEGIRVAKRSYHPCKMIKKYKITFCEE